MQYEYSSLNNGPKDIRYESLETGNVIVYSKRVFRDAVKFMILRWGNYPGLSGWAHLIPRVLKSREPLRDKAGGGGKESRIQRMQLTTGSWEEHQLTASKDTGILILQLARN